MGYLLFLCHLCGVLTALLSAVFAYSSPSLDRGQGDQITILRGPEDSVRVRIDMIRNARSEICLSAYIFGNDRSARALLAEVRAARRRGIRVQVVLDGFGSQISPAILDHLTAEGVEFAVFHPIKVGRNPVSWFARMHDKLFLVDGSSALLGSLNVKDPYFHVNSLGRRMLDREVLVQGDGAREAWRYFQELWSSPFVFPRRNRPTDLAAQIDAAAQLDFSVSVIRRAEGQALSIPYSWRRKPPFRAAATFVSDPIVPGDIFAQGGEERIIDLLQRARSRIVVENPYLIPTENLLNALTEARRRGVEVILLTNSVFSSNQPLAHAAYEGIRGRLLALGIKIFEFQNFDTLHAKTIVVDDRWVYVGSHNWDPRSWFINRETGVIIDSREVAQELNRLTFARATPSVVAVDQRTPCSAPFLHRVVSFLARPQL